MDAFLKENVPYMSRRISGNEQNPVMLGSAAEVMAWLK